MKHLLFAILITLSAGSAQATKIIGNGGDAFAIEFTSIAQAIVEYLELNFTDINAEALKAVVAEVEVSSVNKILKLNGEIKDAINYPDAKKIIFQRARWVELSIEQKSILVLHEYLGIMGIQDIGYKVSRGTLSYFIYRASSVALPCENVAHDIAANVSRSSWGEALGYVPVTMSRKYEDGLYAFIVSIKNPSTNDNHGDSYEILLYRDFEAESCVTINVTIQQ